MSEYKLLTATIAFTDEQLKDLVCMLSEYESMVYQKMIDLFGKTIEDAGELDRSIWEFLYGKTKKASHLIEKVKKRIEG